MFSHDSTGIMSFWKDAYRAEEPFSLQRIKGA